MMTAPKEQAYCHWLVQNKYTGKADLVELGCFLGGLSRALLNGLRERERESPSVIEKQLHVYDRFLWLKNMDRWTATLELERRPIVGENYQSLYEKFMQDDLDRLAIYRIDFSKEKPECSPIEILVIDVIKNAEIAKNVSESFLHKVICGGYIIQQDFMHFGHGWIQILTWKLRNYLQVVWLDPNVSLVSFQVTSTIPEEVCTDLIKTTTYSRREILEAFAWNKQYFPSEYELALTASEIFMLMLNGYGEDLGQERLLDAKRRGWLNHKAFKKLFFFCENRYESWNALKVIRSDAGR